MEDVNNQWEYEYRGAEGWELVNAAKSFIGSTSGGARYQGGG